jgi:tRNA 2-thiouridine synthesizing protein A
LTTCLVVFMAKTVISNRMTNHQDMTPKATPDHLLDATGLKCPLPVLKARRRISEIASGEHLVVLADDPAAPLDFAHFCEVGGHQLLEQSEDEKGQLRFVIVKA